MVNKALTVSIVIPVYNEEDHLKQCLDTVAAQRVMPDEVIVVDNNSTDRTVEIATSYPFVTVIHEPRQSVLYARTTGFNAAKSDIIGRIDADTKLSPNWVKRVRDDFARTPVAAITGPTSFYDMPLAKVNHRIDNFFKMAFFRYSDNFPFLYGTNMAIRRSAWLAVRNKVCMAKDIHEDMDLAIHLIQQDFAIMYDRQLLAGMSSRRYDDSIAGFREYNNQMSRTYQRHNLDTLAPDIAQAIFTLGYFVLWPLRHSYDEKTKARSLRHLFRGRNSARKNPMA